MDDDADLIDRARAGDLEAFAALCERYRRLVWRTVCSVAKGAEAEDLAQEAFVRAFSRRGQYRGDAPFPAWLGRIALNAAHDHLRSAWKRKVVASEDSPPHEPERESLEDEVWRRQAARAVRTAVAALPERQRTPIWLHYFEEFTFAEIARLERSSESTIRSRVKAGLLRLERRLIETGLIDPSESNDQSRPRGPERAADLLSGENMKGSPDELTTCSAAGASR